MTTAHRTVLAFACIAALTGPDLASAMLNAIRHCRACAAALRDAAESGR